MYIFYMHGTSGLHTTFANKSKIQLKTENIKIKSNSKSNGNDISLIFKFFLDSII